jgi:hypothetical protein
VSPAELVARVAPDASATAAVTIPDVHERLGPLVSRHFAKARTLHVLGALAGLVVGLLVLLYGLVASVVTGQLEFGVWLGPLVLAGAAWVLFSERREASQGLGVYQKGFLYRDGARPFALLWTEVAHVDALTEEGVMTMRVTTTGGRVHAISDRVQGLRAIVSIFQNRG